MSRFIKNVAVFTVLCTTLSFAQEYQQYVPSYKAVPRLVPVKVGDSEWLEASEGRNVRITTVRPSSNSLISYPFYQQPGEALPLRRIRVSPSGSPVQHQHQAYQNYPQAVSVSAASPSPYQVSSPVQYSPLYKTSQGVPVQYSRPVQYSSAPVYYPQATPTAAAAPQLQQAPRIVAVRPKAIAQSGVPRQLLKVQKQEAEEEEYPSDPNPQYNFAFDVKDDDFTNYQNRQETRDGGVIKGSYSVVDPDGYVRTVTYTADPKGGFQAKVTREPTDVKIKFPVPTPAPEQTKAGSPLQYAPAAGQYSTGALPRRYPHRLSAPTYAS